jgi:hypothetical protein
MVAQTQKLIKMSDFSQLSNIQLEMELTRVNKSLGTHVSAYEVIDSICREKYGLGIGDLDEIIDSESIKRVKLQDEYQSRINDLGLSAFESTLGQAE